MFKIYSERIDIVRGEDLLNRIVPRSKDNDAYYDLFKEILGLRDIDLIGNFPPSPDSDIRGLLKALKKMVLKHILINLDNIILSLFL